jgi:hypothetical protein
LLAAIAYLRGEGLAACLLLTGAAFCSLGFLLFQARTHWRRDQLEHAFLAQALMQQDSVAHAVWRLDFRSRTMSGGERFNALIGRDLHFSDIASDLFGADQDERDLAAAVFAPAHGRARTFFITHRALGAGGRSVRLTHRAFLQTGLLGRPLALVCITSAAEQPAHMPVSEQWKALRAHYGEASPFDGQAQAPLSQEHRARA